LKLALSFFSTVKSLFLFFCSKAKRTSFGLKRLTYPVVSSIIPQAQLRACKSKFALCQPKKSALFSQIQFLKGGIMEAKKVQSSARDGRSFLIAMGVILVVIMSVLIIAGPPQNHVFGGKAVVIVPTNGIYHINGAGTINFRMVSDDCFTLEKDDFMSVIKICADGNEPFGWFYYTSDWWNLSFPTYSEGTGTISPGGWHFTQGSAMMLLTSDQPITVIPNMGTRRRLDIRNCPDFDRNIGKTRQKSGRV
jgi:hypothetical protein